MDEKTAEQIVEDIKKDLTHGFESLKKESDSLMSKVVIKAQDLPNALISLIRKVGDKAQELKTLEIAIDEAKEKKEFLEQTILDIEARDKKSKQREDDSFALLRQVQTQRSVLEARDEELKQKEQQYRNVKLLQT